MRDLPAFGSVAELPEVPDLALVAVKAAQVNAAIEQCGGRGIPAALVVAAGFSEAGEAEAALEAELLDTARRWGIALIGPNCMGMPSIHSRLHAVGFLELRPQAGALRIVTQSGNSCTTTSSLVFLESRGRVLAERGSDALSSAADAGGVRPGHLAMNKGRTAHQHWGNVNGPSFLDVRGVLYTEHVFDILSMPGVDP